MIWENQGWAQIANGQARRAGVGKQIGPAISDERFDGLTSGRVSQSSFRLSRPFSEEFVRSEASCRTYFDTARLKAIPAVAYRWGSGQSVKPQTPDKTLLTIFEANGLGHR